MGVGLSSTPGSSLGQDPNIIVHTLHLAIPSDLCGSSQACGHRTKWQPGEYLKEDSEHSDGAWAHGIRCVVAQHARKWRWLGGLDEIHEVVTCGAGHPPGRTRRQAAIECGSCLWRLVEAERPEKRSEETGVAGADRLPDGAACPFLCVCSVTSAGLRVSGGELCSRGADPRIVAASATP
ncbi:hypothetical protein NDU88_004165 [Pleurodeles waltl]|uniref:Uncharacterized protein n=1 Tax=Pleurodeles waltl TaxID=8319 RepID=A0AAV7UHD8_PLEWA|nr:hypothetical protein NDU88_004165 [Pleurodeles waltl]